ncbi:intermembrane phospholipid transport protein YdbH family protein [Microbulbifer donghaiensis]|uniref:intermembrane phospholipid transport protein YdbH family protein n=1 Tax=Microbulbifer donghaiensis TaxID=494016 RepID=UPI0011614DC8|nr:YdbH domain-containing protein [Microbulbifer donghaiensis]
MAVLLVIALGGWLWWERDRAVPALINSLIDGGKIESLDGLQLSFGQIDIERLKLALSDGATLHLENVRLLRPFSLIFSGAENRTQVTVERLEFEPPERAVATTAIPEKKEEEPIPAFRLSDTVWSIHRYLPEKLHIRELQWRGRTATPAALDLRRDHTEDTIDAALLSGEQRLSLRIQPQENQLSLVAHLGTAGQDPALSLRCNLAPGDNDTWQTALRLESDLQRIAGLPLLGNLDEIAASASGKLTASIELALPDEALQLQAYRDIVAKLNGESLHLTLPETLLGVPADLSVSTDTPIELSLKSLEPARTEAIAGSATLKLTPTGQPVPLLDLQTQTRSKNEKPSIEVTGTLNLEAASPLLAAPRWQKMLAALKLGSPSGAVHFAGMAKVSPLRDDRALHQSWLSNITLTLLPDSRAGFSYTAELQQDSPASQFGWHKGKVDIRIAKPVNLQIAEWPGDIQITEGTAALQLTPDGGKAAIASELQQVDCTIAEETRCALKLQVAADKIDHKSSTLTIREPKLHTQLDFTLQANRQRWELRQSAFTARQISRDGIEVEDFSFSTTHVECTLADGNPACNSPESITSFSKLKNEEMTASGAVRFDDMHFRLDDSQSQFTSSYRSDNLKFTAQGGYRLEPVLSGKLNLNGNRLRGENQLQAGSLNARAQWRHDLDTAKGNAEFTLEPVKFSQQQPLSESVAGLPLDLVAGTLTAAGKLSWPQTQGDNINVTLNDAAAVYGDSFATGVQTRFALIKPEENWITSKPQPVRIDTLDVGLPVKDIQFTLSLDQKQELRFEKLRAELLGGKLQSEALVWSLKGEERRSLVLLNEISLRELARETEAENFAATGILDLKIPLITSREGITIEHGSVQARAPGGRLRYYGAFSAEMLSSNPQLKLIAGALEDYNYRELSGTVEYPPSGDMQLQLKLVGRSDSVDADRDLIINLNLENNIPAMLRSLQASRDLTEALEKQIQ